MSTTPQNKFSSISQALTQKALTRGYLITDDLLAVFPEAEDNMVELENIFVELINQGVEVYADKEEAEEEEKKFNAIRTEIIYNAEQLTLPETRIQIGRLSLSFRILEKLLLGSINLDKLHWREFEELVADLLEKDGYNVELGPGRNDGGVDIIAYKDLDGVGLTKSIWQAKKKRKKIKLVLVVFVN